ncbi:hypothetical protein PTSG_05709 [Salpingoeca rosetta]|uniref:Uncharacterized protein n=1 Tax=Salpingoeca rosetta (strain ATCC 50818 / BSB-021) TaxID=946362 RepID=F2UAZ9_SALR5|nr:uncharacterized protein PTSG_05709 [Salpingoeca rosetta]EGD74012.1 hypothetical protein PTSG_05709 [Salpingoeca rosetta]|eukprot:XP_004993574.1 hypothetical protein PTSG_05709 [Salpingoeca rosetta]
MTDDWREQPGDWLNRQESSSGNLVSSRASVFLPSMQGQTPSRNDTQGSFSQPASTARGSVKRLSKSALDAVEISEQIVTSLMSLLDALQDVASGSELKPGSQRRACVEASVKSLPEQLNRLLEVTSPSKSAPTSARRLSSRQSSRNSIGRRSMHESTSSQQYQQAPLYEDMDDTERRLRMERERQERIKRRDNRGRPPPNFNLMMAEAEMAKRTGRRTSTSMQDQQEAERAEAERRAMEQQQAEEEEYMRQQQQMQQQQQDSYAGLDETERRLRMEAERQERIKQRVVSSFGRPPPNFRVLSSQSKQQQQQQQSPASGGSGGGGDSRPVSRESRTPRLTTAELAALSWREQLKYRKRMQAEQEQQMEQEEEREQARFEGMPAWKAALLKERQRKKWEAEAPMREAQRRERERQEWFNSLPQWKQDLLIKKQMAQ